MKCISRCREFDNEAYMATKEAQENADSRFPKPDGYRCRAARSEAAPFARSDRADRPTLQEVVPALAPVLPRARRLRDGRDFRRVRNEGRSWSVPLLVLQAARRPDGPDNRTRIGVVAGKRVGGAVVRNRVKRRVRESVRLRYDRLERGWDIVFIVRSQAADSDFRALDGAVAQLFARAGVERDQACVDSHSG